MQIDSPLLVLYTLESQLRLHEEPNDEGQVMYPDSVVVPLVDLVLARTECFNTSIILSSAVTIKSILTLASSSLAKSHTHLLTNQDRIDFPLLSQTTDFTDRIQNLKLRISRISAFLLNNIDLDPTHLTQFQTYPSTEKYECSATADIEAFVKDIVSTATVTLISVRTDGQDVRMNISEQIIVFLENEYARILRDTEPIPTGEHDDLTPTGIHDSCSACFGGLTARSNHQIWMLFSECCIEIQTKMKICVIADGRQIGKWMPFWEELNRIGKECSYL
ncbi:hypothetical protein BDR26DRAFT_871862 [Obelidium mucronatum]|nr:hypothetical protein BDR26DRAFT_871862 [Obelidium mucronatum]